MARKKLTGKNSKALSAMERKDLKAVTRSELMVDPRSKEVLERVFRLALDQEEDAPAQLQAFALKTVTDLMLGTEVDPKTASEKISINITGLGSNEPKDVYDGGVTIEGVPFSGEEDG